MTEEKGKENSHYDQFYAKGGWQYKTWRANRFFKKLIIKPLNIAKGSDILELGCGMGFHSYILHKMGYKVVGVDKSSVGIAYAKEHFEGPLYHSIDAKDLENVVDVGSFDVIYVRGMSWYHYELLGVNSIDVDVPKATEDFFRFLKPGGLFILQIKTDFSGSITKDGVHNNTYDDYVNLFKRFGQIISVSNWKGRILRYDADARKLKNSIIIATRKPTTVQDVSRL